MANVLDGNEANMDGWWIIFWWSGPLGIGIFLALLGIFILLVAKADAISKRTRAEFGANRR